MERTCDIEKIKAGAPFSWGKAVGWHEIGPYSILEYHPWEMRGPHILAGEPDYEKIRYHGWLSGKNMGTGYSTLEAAIVGLIAIRYDGRNSQAGEYFMRVISWRELETRS